VAPVASRKLQLGWAGYSMGGGMVYRALELLGRGFYPPPPGEAEPTTHDPAWKFNYITPITAYMDAIIFGEMTGVGQAEERLPPGTLGHWNFFQSHDEDGIGLWMPTLPDNFQGIGTAGYPPNSQFDLDYPSDPAFGWKGYNFWGGSVPQPPAGQENEQFTHVSIDGHMPMITFLVDKFKVCFVRD
jgi:hypothetical protein